MFRRWRQSLIHPTLLRTGVGAGLLIAGITVLTYTLIFRAVEERGLIHLDEYVSERVMREENHFVQNLANLMVAKEAFIERYRQPDPPGYLARFDEIFMRFPDGAVRNRPEHGDGTKETNMWSRKDIVFDDELKRRVLIIYDVCEKFLPAWSKTFPSIYATTPEQQNIGFDPSIPKWIYDTEADRDQNALLEGSIISMPKNNPLRIPVWTGPQIEPTYGEYLVTLCVPVDIDGRYVANWGHDVRMEDLIETSVRAEVTGLTHMIFRDDGRLIAHPHKKEAVVAAHGNFFMKDEAQLNSLHRAVAGRSERRVSGFDQATGLYFCALRMEGPNWWFLTTLPRSVLSEQAFRYAQWVLWVGVAAIVVLLVFLWITLRNSVARPLRELTLAANLIGEDGRTHDIEVVREDELGQLATAFNRMARTVTARDTSLRELNADLERRIAERTTELQSSEARIRAMLEHTPEAIVVIDADTWQYRTGNENVLRFLGVDRETLRKSGPGAFSPPTQPDGNSSPAKLKEYAAAVLAGRGPTVFEWTIRRRDGTEVPTEIRLSRLPAENRNLLIGTITDISERKQAEASLLAALARERELGEMKSGFVSMVSHEFRTPLGIISSSSEILSRYFDRLDPAVRAEHLDTIFRSTRALNRLIDEVLLLGKVEAGRITYTPAPINLPVLCGVLADEVHSSTGHDCPIEIVQRGELGGAAGDESILRHIFTNLLSNAAKYSRPGGAVTFEIERAGDDAIFCIRDRGIGISPEDLRTLFTAFRRGRNVGTRTGTGLGLVIVRRCVDLHGGSIEIESELGKGTCATVRLPLFAASPVSAAPSTTEESPSPAP